MFRSFIVRYYAYCGAISATFTYPLFGMNWTATRIALGMTCVLWLACMGVGGLASMLMKPKRL